MQRKIESKNKSFNNIRIKPPPSSSFSSSRDMDLISPSKDDKLSARKLAAIHWETNGLKSPSSEKGKIGNLRNTHLLDHINSPVCKGKDEPNLGRHHQRKPSTNSQRLQLIEYTEGEEMDSVINGAFEAAATLSIRTRLKELRSSLTGSKEIIKALLRLLTQQGNHSSSRITLASALRVEIDRARYEVDQLISNEEDAKKTLLKIFASEKATWKRQEQDKIVKALSSVSRELQIEQKLRRRSDRLSQTLAKELAEKKDELAKANKKIEREKRATELKTEEVEIEEKNAALERLRSDLQVYLGGKQGFDDANSENGEEGSEESEMNSIELSMDSLSKSCTWSFAKDDCAEEVFKGRRSLCEQIQWENICLQREKKEVCGQNERSDHKVIKEIPI